MSYFNISDFPEQSRWLTEDERVFIIARTSTEKDTILIKPHSVLSFLEGPKNILGGIMYIGQSYRVIIERECQLRLLIKRLYLQYTVSTPVTHCDTLEPLM